MKKPGTTEVKAFEDVKSAKKVIADAIARYDEAHPEVKMAKDAEKFVNDTKAKISETVEKAKKAFEEM